MGAGAVAEALEMPSASRKRQAASGKTYVSNSGSWQQHLQQPESDGSEGLGAAGAGARRKTRDGWPAGGVGEVLREVEVEVQRWCMGTVHQQMMGMGVSQCRL